MNKLPWEQDPVRSLQAMLDRLAQLHPCLPRLEQDGVFGKKTLKALTLFQQEFAPPVTGRMDRRTMTALRKLFLEADRLLTDSVPVRLFPGEGYAARPGTDADFLILPQAMFQVLGRTFVGILPAPADGAHGSRSTENVRWLQRAAGLEPSGTLDVRSWNLLCRLYEAAVVWAPEHSGRCLRSPDWG